MKVILPTSFFPPVSYVSSLLKAEEVIIDIHETFPKQTLRNRYEILTSQGRFRLSVPLSGRSNSSKTFEINVSDDQKWREQHWRSIKTAYGSAPYFEHYEGLIQSLLYYNAEKLVDLNLHALTTLLNQLKINKEIKFSEHYLERADNRTDLRELKPSIALPRYMQVFENKTGFVSDLSIIDLLFNLGPRSVDYLSAI